LKIGLFLGSGVAFGGLVWSNHWAAEVEMEF